MTARRKTSPAQALTRRRFVTMVAAGSAVLLARPGLAAPGGATRRKHSGGPATKPAPPPSATSSAAQKEFDRQRAGTLATLKTLRDHPLPPGGDLPVVFRPQRTRRKDR